MLSVCQSRPYCLCLSGLRRVGIGLSFMMSAVKGGSKRSCTNGVCVEYKMCIRPNCSQEGVPNLENVVDIINGLGFLRLAC